MPVRSRARLALLLSPLVVPWSVQAYATGHVSLVFAWGLVDATSWSVTTIFEFLFRYTAGLPTFILAWPTGVLMYALALASGVVGVLTGREDPRVTAGLLVFAGVAQLSVSQGFAVQPGRTAYPTGTLVLWAVAVWWYWQFVRAAPRN